MKYLGTGKDVCPTCGGKKHDFEQHSRDSCIVVLRDRTETAEERTAALKKGLLKAHSKMGDAIQAIRSHVPENARIYLSSGRDQISKILAKAEPNG